MSDLEKALAAAVSPVVDLVLEVEKKLADLTLEKGPQGDPGRDADPVDVSLVAKELVEQHADSLRGPQGDPGSDAPAVDLKSLAAVIVEEYGESLRGQKGEDAPMPVLDVTLIVDGLAKDYTEQLRGAPGKDADPIDPSLVAEKLATEHLGALQGQPGLGIDTKAFVEGQIYREGTFVTAHMGQTFKALKDTVATPGDSSDWERIGSGGFRMTGPYSAEKEYKDGDMFIRDFGCFLVYQGESKLLAGRGPEGKRGLPGLNGTDGKDGSTLLAGEQKDAKLILLFSDREGKVETVEFDLAPAVEKMLDAQRKSMELGFEDLVSEMVTKVLNETDVPVGSTPIKFFKGMWQGDEPYTTGDVVTYAGQAMICIASCRGVIPQATMVDATTAGMHWRPMSGNAAGAAPNTEAQVSKLQIKELVLATCVPGFITALRIGDPAYPYYEQQNSDFALEFINNSSFRIKPTGPVIFPDTFSSDHYIVTFPEQVVQTSSIPLPIGDGIYVRYVGFESNGVLTYSESPLAKDPKAVQLGSLILKRELGVITFLDEVIGSPVRSQPNLASIDNFARTATPFSTSARALPNGANLSLNLFGGYNVSECIGWGNGTADVHEFSVNSAAAFNFRRVDGGTLARTTLGGLFSVVDPTRYWNGSALTPLAANGNASVQRILMTQGGGMLVQFGEFQYTNFQDAIDAMDVAPFTPLLPTSFATELARIAMVKTATALNDNAQAVLRRVANRVGGGMI